MDFQPCRLQNFIKVGVFRVYGEFVFCFRDADVLDHNGVLSWQEFSNHFGDDMEESPYWQYHPPQTTMGRLRVRGLLIEGIVDERLIVTIPMELREPISTLV